MTAPEPEDQRPSVPAYGNGAGRWEKLGEVAVDSASIVIGDLMSSDTFGERSKAQSWPVHGGIRIWAGFGDGGYDVWGWIVDYGLDGKKDERVAQVVMTMIDERDLASRREPPFGPTP